MNAQTAQVEDYSGPADVTGDIDGANTGGTDVNPAELSVAEKLTTIKEKIDQINNLKAERSEVQADIQAAREAIVAMGIPKKAMDMAMAYMAMDEKQRKGFDAAYAMVRQAIGLPMQTDWVDQLNT